MLIDFTTANYRSIKEEATLSMVAAQLKSRDSLLDSENLIVRQRKPPLLKSAAVYGANAGGKSNVIKALTFMRRMVLRSATDAMGGDEIPTEAYALSPETENAPSFFEAIFELNAGIYRYGFEVTRTKVISEWLFHNKSRREALLFTREGGEFKLGNGFSEGRDLEDKTRENALFLSVVAQFNGTVANKVVAWFRSIGILSGLEDHLFRKFSLRCLEGDLRDEMLALIKSMDLGIENLQVQESTAVETLKLSGGDKDALPKGFFKTLASESAPVLYTQHPIYNEAGKKLESRPFEFGEMESEGTQKLFSLSGPLLDTLKNGTLLVVDELDARLHPLITIKIIQLFNSRQTNPNNAQLIFTTHDTNILDKRYFRRDQIWFTEKDRFGATSLFSLADYKIRNDAAYGPNYLKGKYGAIPFLSDPVRLPGDA